MISDRDLDDRLAAAGGVPDAELPPLPEGFLAHLTEDADAGLSLVADAPAEEPASVIAARQLVADAREGRRRRPTRRTVLRIGAAAVAIAAAWTTAVVVTSDPGSDGGVATPTTSAPVDPTGTPPEGIQLVAAEEVAFPFSLDPAPEGLTPSFSMRGGEALTYYGDLPLQFVADYSSDEGRVLIDLFASDPREMPDTGWSDIGEPVGTATVGGVEAEVKEDDGVVTLLWERSDGQWVWVLGEGSYGDRDALLAVAASIVDRPQPVGLQLRLAPAGWTVGGYEESRSLDLVPGDDPSSPPLRVSLYGGPGYTGPVEQPLEDRVTVDQPFEGRALAGPVEPVTIQGTSGRIAFATDSGGWLVTGQLPGGPLFLMLAPEVLTRDQVLQIAEQIAYTP